MYNLLGWDDFTTLVLTRELSLGDYVYRYWGRLAHHLLTADEAAAFQQTWTAYSCIGTLDDQRKRQLGFRKNSRFLNRLEERATHTMKDWLQFQSIHAGQYRYFRDSTVELSDWISKYFLD